MENSFEITEEKEKTPISIVAITFILMSFIICIYFAFHSYEKAPTLFEIVYVKTGHILDYKSEVYINMLTTINNTSEDERKEAINQFTQHAKNERVFGSDDKEIFLINTLIALTIIAIDEVSTSAAVYFLMLSLMLLFLIRSNLKSVMIFTPSIAILIFSLFLIPRTITMIMPIFDNGIIWVIIPILVFYFYKLYKNEQSNEKYKKWPTLSEYINQNPNCKTIHGIRCKNCNSGYIRHVGWDDRHDARRLHKCNICNSYLYRSSN